MRISALLLPLFLMLPAVSLQADKLALVTGKLTVGAEKTAAAGVRVMAWPVETGALDGDAPHASQPTAEDGRFGLQLGPGSYYFIAEGAELYCFYGRNPVTVSEAGGAELNLSLVERSPPPVTAAPRVATGILGRLTHNGQPLEGAVVTVYTDLNSQLKGMGLGMTAPTGPDGLFEAPLQAGTYYLVARKRNSGAFMGPLQAGDYFGYYPANPLRITEGQIAEVSFATVEVPEKVGQLAGALFGETSISGQVVDARGNPVAGVQVMLYGDATMINRPLYTSQPTSADGRFALSFPHGGVYWLAARNRLGGPPAPGELYGRYQGSPDGSIRIETGQDLEKIKLIVEELQ